MGLKDNDTDKEILAEGYGPTIILFAAVLLGLFITSVFG